MGNERLKRDHSDHRTSGSWQLGSRVHRVQLTGRLTGRLGIFEPFADGTDGTGADGTGCLAAAELEK